MPFKESSKLTNGKYGIMIYFKTNSVLSWPSNRRRCKQWSEGRTSSNDFYFTQRTSIGLQISNQQGAIKMIKRIKWHHVEHHLLRWSRKGAINTYISSAHVRDGAWGPIGPGGPVGEPWRWEEGDYLFLYRNVGRFENPGGEYWCGGHNLPPPS